MATWTALLITAACLWLWWALWPRQPAAALCMGAVWLLLLFYLTTRE